MWRKVITLPDNVIIMGFHHFGFIQEPQIFLYIEEVVPSRNSFSFYPLAFSDENWWGRCHRLAGPLTVEVSLLTCLDQLNFSLNLFLRMPESLHVNRLQSEYNLLGTDAVFLSHHRIGGLFRFHMAFVGIRVRRR